MNTPEIPTQRMAPRVCDRLTLHEGGREYVIRVEAVTPDGDGYRVCGAVVWPRSARGNIVTATVAA